MTTEEHLLQYAVHELLKKYNIFHFETDVMDALKYMGKNQKMRFGYINHHSRMGYRTGQPDMVVIKLGKVYFVELKTLKGTQSKEQKQVENVIKSQGCEYLIWRSREDCARFILEK